jgi:hypothetical protein
MSSTRHPSPKEKIQGVFRDALKKVYLTDALTEPNFWRGRQKVKKSGKIISFDHLCNTRYARRSKESTCYLN